MNTLDRYLFSQFFRNLILVLLAIIMIYLLVDFFEKIDNFIKAGKTAGMTLRYLLMKIPQITQQIMPVCLLLAAVITLGILNHNRELMALLAGGISMRRVIRPLLTATACLILLGLAVDQWILPSTIGTTNKIWYEEVKKTQSHGIRRNDMIYYRGRTGVYSFRHANQELNIFVDFNYLAWDHEYRLTRLLHANEAHFQDGAWICFDGTDKTPGNDGLYRTKAFTEMTVTLPDDPVAFFIPKYKSNELSISQLIDDLRHDPLNRDTNLRILHGRLSYILLGFPLVLLGLPILLLINRKWGHDLSLAVPVSCIMAFGVWGLWNVGQTMIPAYHLSPALVSWSIHFVTATLGIMLLHRQQN